MPHAHVASCPQEGLTPPRPVSSGDVPACQEGGDPTQCNAPQRPALTPTGQGLRASHSGMLSFSLWPTCGCLPALLSEGLPSAAPRSLGPRELCWPQPALPRTQPLPPEFYRLLWTSWGRMGHELCDCAVGRQETRWRRGPGGSSGASPPFWLKLV